MYKKSVFKTYCFVSFLFCCIFGLLFCLSLLFLSFYVFPDVCASAFPEITFPSFLSYDQTLYVFMFGAYLALFVFDLLTLFCFFIILRDFIDEIYIFKGGDHEKFK